MENLTVGYSRKQTIGNYNSIGVNASMEFKPTSEDLQKEVDQALVALKLILDAKLEEFAGVSNEPDLGPEPDWVGQNPERIAALLATGPIPAPPVPPQPVPHPQPAPSVVASEAAYEEADHGLPEIPSNVGTGNKGNASPQPVNVDGDVYLARAKVFRSEMKRGRTNRAYAELRVGHDDLIAHIGEQYITVRIFDPQYAAVVGSLTKMKNEETGGVEDVMKLNIKEKDFVNLWGKFSPWTSNPNKFDLNATAIQKAE